MNYLSALQCAAFLHGPESELHNYSGIFYVVRRPCPPYYNRPAKRTVNKAAQTLLNVSKIPLKSIFKKD